MKFLDKLAEHIKQNEYDLSDLCIVLPSERAKKYLIQSLFNSYQKAFFAPKMVTMDKWIHELVGLPVLDKTRLSILLYKIYCRNEPQGKDLSFDNFMLWAKMLLSDFDEIDRYLIDPKSLFKNLQDVKEIENWSFNDEELSDKQKQFMEFWNKLQTYYDELSIELDKIKSTTSAKSFKKVAENIDLVFQKNKREKLIFAGFNALSNAELRIIKELIKINKAEIFVDADKYYLDNESHEAGMFLRKLKKELQISKFPNEIDQLKEREINVHLFETTMITGQAKIMGNLLSEFDEEKIDNTLIMLADESLILPVLQNIPAKVKHANITLGLPLKHTPIYSWVEILFNIQENKKKFKGNGLYFKDFLKLFNHPFTLKILDDAAQKKLIKFKQEIHRKNKIYISTKGLSNEIGDLAQTITDLSILDWDGDYKLALQNIRQINQIIYKHQQEEFTFEKAIILAFDSSLTDLQNIVEEAIPEMGIKTFKSLFNQHWFPASIAYHGNPIDGLQIMGLLETRLLDFENIICLGMNEGTLPPTNDMQTLIPMDLRRFFELPTPREKQGIYAHHFYRLLHNAKNLYITYTTATEVIGSSEKSRYLTQLELELSRVNPNFKINTSYYTLSAEKNENLPLELAKNQQIITRIDEILKASTSASLLKTYLSCTMDFYYTKVLDFQETEEIEEELDNNTFGTAIHQTLEQLYLPFAMYGKKGETINVAPPSLTERDIDNMLLKYKAILKEKILLYFDGKEDAINQGKNFLSLKMADKLVEQFLQSEKLFLSKCTERVMIHSLERKYQAIINLPEIEENYSIRLSGEVDRIDWVGEKLRIIDYKTGTVGSKDVVVPEIAALCKTATQYTPKFALQLLIYNYLFNHHEGYLPDETLVYGLRYKNNAFKMSSKKPDLNSVVEELPEILTRIISDMRNVEVPFLHKQKMISYCKYCV